MPLNLVVQTAFLGDLLLCIPLLKKLKSLYPEQKLGLVCRKGFGSFFIKAGLVDEVFEVQKGKKDTYQKALSEIKKFDVGVLISPHESLRTALFCGQISARKKIGYKKLWNFIFFSERFVRDPRLPDALRQLSLLQNEDEALKEELTQYLNLGDPFKPDAQHKLPESPSWASMSLRKDILRQAESFLEVQKKFSLVEYTRGPVVLLFPGSVWATKRWTETGFIETGKKLQSQGYQVIVMGGPGEEALAEKVSSEIPGVRSLAGQSAIFESALMIAHAALVVGNDSASTHLAAVCETPLIAVFGPTILGFGFRPWSQTSYVVETLGLACRPCGKHGHDKCPIGTHVCMKRITSDEVVQIAKSILPDTLSR